MDMVDRARRIEPLILAVLPVILGGLGWLLYNNTTLIAKNQSKLQTVVSVQPDMTKKLNHITALLQGVQTKEAAREQYNELRGAINRNDKRITVLENRVNRLEDAK